MEEECNTDQYRTVDHATFKAAMELLGVDVEELNGLSIGNWTDDDRLMWPLAGVMQKNGSFWRIKFSTDFEAHGTRVQYIGIEYPDHE